MSTKSMSAHHVKKLIAIIASAALVVLMALFFKGEMTSPAERLGFYCAALALAALLISLWLQLKKAA